MKLSHEFSEEKPMEVKPPEAQESGWYDIKTAPFPLSQGDVLMGFMGFRLSYIDDQSKKFIKPIGYMTNAIVLTQDCDLLKDKTSDVIFCPIIPFEEAVINHILAGTFAAKIKENKETNPDYSLKNISQEEKTEKIKEITRRTIEKTTSDFIQGRLIDFYVIEASEKFPPQVVLLKESYTLPIESVRKYLSLQGEEQIYSLKSPYKEHMAQAFALTFSRIGLPINLSSKPLEDRVKATVERVKDGK